MLNHLSNLHHHHWHSSLADKTKQPESLKDAFVEVGSNLNRVVLLFLGLALLFAPSFAFLGNLENNGTKISQIALHDLNLFRRPR